jgi:hypothetical protein
MKRQRAALFLGILGVGLSIPMAARTAPSARPDWILGVVTARAPVYVEMQWDWQIKRAGAAPVVFGASNVISGLPRDPSYDWVWVEALPFEPLGVTSSKGARGLSLSLPGPNPVESALGAAGQKPQAYSGGRGELELQPGQTWATLAFVANATFDKLSWAYRSNDPSAVKISVRTGHGSRAISVGDSRNEGLAAGGSFAAGSVMSRTRVSSGIVGAMDVACDACRGAWAAPLDLLGNWASRPASMLVDQPSPMDQPNKTAFAGPGGNWSWQWIGATDPTAPTQLAAWAPVGDAWRLFKDIPAW